MKTSSSYYEAPQLGSHRVFKLKEDALVVEHRTKNQDESGILIVELARIVLPSIQTEGRNIKMLKGSINILVFIVVVAMSVCAIFTVSPEWVWAGAGIIALPFFVTLMQSLRKNKFEVFKDAQGETLFELRRAKGDEEEFAAFLAGLKIAMQQDRSINEQPMAAERGDVANAANAHTEGAVLPPPLPRANATDAQSEALVKKITSGAHWLYWVAGLSGINILLTHLGVEWRFAVGLGITELIYAIGLQFGSIGTAAGAFFSIVAIGCLGGLGYAAAKRQLWAFILGIIALSLDTLLLVLLGALAGTNFLIGIIIHVVAIVFLGIGCNALWKFKKRQNLAP